MPRLVSEEYPELFHYTSFAGVRGIIESQTLWATHYGYLNDSQEIRHFGNRLEPVIQDVLEEVFAYLKTAEPQKYEHLIAEQGGLEKIKQKQGKTLVSHMYDVFLKDSPPYITSFCTHSDEIQKRHGLLSQWRGYGRDGGCAIVFDTKRVEDLLSKESESWDYNFLQAGDALYDSASYEQKITEEIGEHIQEIKKGVRQFYYALFKSDPDIQQKAFQGVYPAIIFCSCRYKHWGFEEEKEVRIVAMLRSEKGRQVAEAKGHALKPAKSVKHFRRGDTELPYIELFEGISEISRASLPIKNIIVGPHLENERRREALESLLRHHGYYAPVSVSEIPYLGFDR